MMRCFFLHKLPTAGAGFAGSMINLFVDPAACAPGTHRFYMPAQAIAPGPHWAFRLQLAVEMANVLAGLIVLAVGYRRLRNSHERRDLRRVSLAALVSFGALVIYFLMLSSEPSSPVLRWIYESKATGFVLLFLWSIFPIMFAYTVLYTGRQPSSSVANSV